MLLGRWEIFIGNAPHAGDTDSQGRRQPLKQIAAIEQLAGVGEVVVSPETLSLLHPALMQSFGTVTALEGGGACLTPHCSSRQHPHAASGGVADSATERRSSIVCNTSADARLVRWSEAEPARSSASQTMTTGAGEARLSSAPNLGRISAAWRQPIAPSLPDTPSRQSASEGRGWDIIRRSMGDVVGALRSTLTGGKPKPRQHGNDSPCSREERVAGFGGPAGGLPADSASSLHDLVTPQGNSRTQVVQSSHNSLNAVAEAAMVKAPPPWRPTVEAMVALSPLIRRRLALLLQMHVSSCIRSELRVGSIVSDISTPACLFISIPGLEEPRPGVKPRDQLDSVQHVITQVCRSCLIMLIVHWLRTFCNLFKCNPEPNLPLSVILTSTLHLTLTSLV